MRILWLNHRDIDHPLAGGAERTIYEIGSRLALRGHTVTLIASQWRGGPSKAMHAGISIMRFPGNLGPHIAASAFQRTRHWDVIVDDLAHAAPWLSPWFAKTLGTAFFHHLHGRTLPGQTAPPLRYVLSAAERLYPYLYQDWPFVTEASTGVNDLLQLGVTPEKIHRIPPGTNLELFQPGPKSPQPQLVYFGGMRKYKRPEVAVDVLKILSGRGFNAKLVVVGEGPALSMVRQRGVQVGVEKSIEYLGRISDVELARVLAESWVNIHASVAEGWGRSVSEAAASGTPTVAFAVPGVVDSVKNGVTGILVKDSDVTALSEGCTRILEDPEPWFRRCVLEGRRRSWEDVANDWEKHLMSIVEAHGGRSWR